jgi:hypothetical protein
MKLRAALALALLAGAAAAFGQTIYKYRRADGQTVYSSERLPGLELIDTIESRSPPAAAQPPATTDTARKAEDARKAEERIQAQIEALNVAWNEVRDAEAALAAAEARLREGVQPQEAEPRQLGGAAQPVPPAVGGPQPPAPPAVGGAGPTPPPAIGGPLGTRQGGGGRSPEYAERMGKLEADVAEAQARLDRAIQKYNALR